MRTFLVLIIGVVILGLIGGVGYFYFYKPTTITPSPIPTPIDSPTPLLNSESFCTPSQIHAQISSEGAAGNIFGTITFKNISDSTCQILGNNFPEAKIDPAIKNITVSHVGQPTIELFTISPNQTVYSQLHYPNGPQCSGAANQKLIEFTYKISTASVSLKIPSGDSLQVPSCPKESEKTDIQIWALSDKPITP